MHELLRACHVKKRPLVAQYQNTIMEEVNCAMLLLSFLWGFGLFMSSLVAF